MVPGCRQKLLVFSSISLTPSQWNDQLNSDHMTLPTASNFQPLLSRCVSNASTEDSMVVLDPAEHGSLNSALPGGHSRTVYSVRSSDRASYCQRSLARPRGTGNEDLGSPGFHRQIEKTSSFWQCLCQLTLSCRDAR